MTGVSHPRHTGAVGRCHAPSITTALDRADHVRRPSTGIELGKSYLFGVPSRELAYRSLSAEAPVGLRMPLGMHRSV
jgi:hypothetical protein